MPFAVVHAHNATDGRSQVRTERLHQARMKGKKNDYYKHSH